MILTVCADKGSPGVTTAATVLGMVWPGERVVLEADPSGGDLALRLRTPQGQLLPAQPTVRALSVDARSGTVTGSLSSYAHETSLGVPVIPASDMSSADLGLVARQWPPIAAVAHAWPGTVIADLGRLQEDSAAGALAAASTAVLLIARSNPDGLYHLRERAAALSARLGQGLHGRTPLAVAVICPAKHHQRAVAELSAHLESDPATATVPVAGWIAHDPKALDLLRAGAVTSRFTGSDLVCSAVTVADTLLDWHPAFRPAVPSEDDPAAPETPAGRAADAGPVAARGRARSGGGS